jgi:hypothetical protein
MKMAQKHLETARLLALYHGDTEDFAALEHLVSCAECQQAFDDSRWLMLLRRLPRLVQAGAHPASDVLVAYRSHALSTERTADIERHLRACDRCTAQYRRAQTQEAQVQYRSPAPASVRKALKDFRQRTLRRLGTVFVAALDKQGLFRLVLMPESSGVRGATAVSHDGSSIIEPVARRRAHPASATRRARRIGKWIENFSAGASIEEPAFEQAARELDTAESLASEAGSSAETGTLRIPADRWELLLVPSREGKQLRLAVRLIATENDRSASGVRIRIRNRQGRESAALTDDEGHAALTITPGQSEITIEVDPILVLRLDFPS